MREPKERADGSDVAPQDGDSLPVADILDILRLILRVEPLDVLLQKVVDTIASRFNMSRVVLAVLDERTGLFCPKALHGFPPDKAMNIKRHAYTMERMRNDLRPEFKIGRTAYYVRAEDQSISYNDVMDYVMNEDLIDVPRASPSDWHELDYIDFVMTDRLGNWTGYVEIDEPGDRKVPSKAVIDRIQILADLTSIAIENAKTYEDAVDAMADSQGYLDLIVHDIGNMVGPLTYYLNGLTAAHLDERSAFLARNALAIASSIKKLTESVRKLSELRASEPAAKEVYDLAEVLSESADAVRREFPTKNIKINLMCPETPSQVLADELIFDLFINLLSNSVKYSRGNEVEIDVHVSDERAACTVRIEDRGIGIPDERKGQIFSRFARRPDGVSGTGLGLSIVALLVERYHGIISVRDRVPGDFSQGTCFEVSLPKPLHAENVDKLRAVTIVPEDELEGLGCQLDPRKT